MNMLENVFNCALTCNQ